VLLELVALGYDILQMARSDERIGVVAVLFKEGLGVKVIHFFNT